jgi:hypothetical protein
VDVALRVRLFVVATVLAILLPAAVDSSTGEEQVAMSQMGTQPARGYRPMSSPPYGATPGCASCPAFLTLFMAFLLRQHPFSGWEDYSTLLLALVIGAAGLGNTVGTLVGSVLKSVRPQIVVVVVLLADVVVVTTTTVIYSLVTAVALGLTVGICQSLESSVSTRSSSARCRSRFAPASSRDQRRCSSCRGSSAASSASWCRCSPSVSGWD